MTPEDFMRRLGATPVEEAPRLPDADVLLLKAQLIRRWEAHRRAAMPIDVMQPFEIAAGMAAAMLLLFWSVPSIFDWIPALIF
jgi:hypothetical protein